MQLSSRNSKRETAKRQRASFNRFSSKSFSRTISLSNSNSKNKQIPSKTNTGPLNLTVCYDKEEYDKYNEGAILVNKDDGAILQFNDPTGNIQECIANYPVLYEENDLESKELQSVYKTAGMQIRRSRANSTSLTNTRSKSVSPAPGS